MESGYLRPTPGGELELLVSQPTGFVEIHRGTLDSEGTLALTRLTLAASPDAKPVHDVRRVMRVQGDTLTYDLWMAHGDTPADASSPRHPPPRDGPVVAMEMPSWKAKELTPGQLSERSGVAVSALHFYEREGSSSVAGPAETSADTNETRFDASPSSESRNASAFRCRKSERPSAHFLKAVPPRTAQIGKDCRPGGGATSIYASSNWNVYGTTSPVASVAGASRWRGAPSPTRTINSHPPARVRAFWK